MFTEALKTLDNNLNSPQNFKAVGKLPLAMGPNILWNIIAVELVRVQWNKTKLKWWFSFYEQTKQCG